jgi:hypothetical protein
LCICSDAKENLESLVTSSTAWRGKYQDVGGEVDETRTPECAEGFVTLLTVITGMVNNEGDCVDDDYDEEE